MSKERQSKLDPHAEVLGRWFGEEKISLLEAQKRLLLDFNISVSPARLSEWWQGQQESRMREQILSRIASGAETCRQLERQFSKDAPPEIETLIKLLRVLVMQLAVQGQADPAFLKSITPLMSQVLEHLKIQERGKDRDLEERRVKLLETKAALADKAKEVIGGKLSPEEQQLKLRQIFGIG